VCERATSMLRAVLLARQYVEMPRSRIEGLLAAFPKLLSGEDKSRQHTFIETESVRYVYFPTEGMHVVLITTKGSNIVEDLSTLQLAAKCVPEFGMSETGDVTEDTVMAHAFDIIFAFDEAISAGGQAEQVTIDQIRTFMEMDSAEERLQLLIDESRAKAAIRQGTSAAKDIDRRKREAMRTGGAMLGKMTGVGSSDITVTSAGFERSSSPPSRRGGFGSSDVTSISSSSASSSSSSHHAPPVNANAGRGGGLKLGGSKTRAGLSLGGNKLSAAMEEMGLADDASGGVASATTSAEAAVNAAARAAAAAVADQLDVEIEEQVSCEVTRDGGFGSLEVKGVLSIKCNDEASTSGMLHCDREATDYDFQFQTHPKMDRALWTSDAALVPKVRKGGLPLGGQGVKVLRWKYTGKDESSVPLAVTCWPDPLGDGTSSVSLEYTFNAPAWPGLVLYGVAIHVPLPPTAGKPEVSDIPAGTVSVQGGALVWTIQEVSAAARTNSLEFTVKGENIDAFFPVSVTFEANKTLCGLAVRGAEAEDGTVLRVGNVTKVGAAGYVVS
jgi:coatomer subunit delta